MALTEKEKLVAKAWLEYDIPRQVRLTNVWRAIAFIVFVLSIMVGPQFVEPQVYYMGIFLSFLAMLLLAIRLRVLNIVKLLQAYIEESRCG